MKNSNVAARRKALKIIGGTAMLPLVGALGGCSGDKDEPQRSVAKPAEPKPQPAETAGGTEAPAAEAPATTAKQQLPALTEDDPQAKSLAYVEDATSVDTSQQARYEDGQACSNCALFIAMGDSARGACSIFPGKSVNANGWCSVYAAKP